MSAGDSQSSAPALDRTVWDEIIRLTPKLLIIALSKAPTREDAEDAVQESIARVSRRQNLRIESLEGYLAVSVTNACNDQWRSLNRERLRNQRLVRVEPEFEDDTDSLILDEDLAHWIHSKLPILPERQRQIVELRIQGHSLKQAAESLGVTYKAAHTAFSRAQETILAIVKGTLGAIVVFVNRSRIRAAASAVGLATVGLATLLLVLPWSSRFPHSAEIRTNTTTGSRSQIRSSSPSPQRTQAVMHPGPTSRKYPTAKSSPDQVVLISTPMLGRRGVITDSGIKVVDEDPSQTLLQTLRDCLKNGIFVGPLELGCPE